MRVGMKLCFPAARITLLASTYSNITQKALYKKIYASVSGRLVAGWNGRLPS